MADVTDKASLDAAVSRITAETGYINLLVNNAGTLGRRHNTLPRAPPFNKIPSQFVNAAKEDDLDNIEGIRDFLWKDEVSDWDQTLRTNVSGVWFPSIAFLTLLSRGNKKQNVVQKSQIVTIGSVGAFIRILGTSFAYNPSKAAANHLAKMMATNFVQWGIRSVRLQSLDLRLAQQLTSGAERHSPRHLPIGNVSRQGKVG